ncbi:hypothetical protein B6E66_13440 [Streptomyces maremycinicus]|nr:hypothetical protein B6E66_13440 [Streptomyces sp. B9173]
MVSGQASARRIRASRPAGSAGSCQRSLVAVQAPAYSHQETSVGSQSAGSLSLLEQLELPETAISDGATVTAGRGGAAG